MNNASTYNCVIFSVADAILQKEKNMAEKLSKNKAKEIWHQTA